MAVRQDILRQVDSPFPPSLGPRSGMKIDGEEWYLLEEIAKTHALFYSAEAVVYHRIEPERINWDWMRRVYFQRGIGLGPIDRLRGEPPADLPRRIVRPIRSLRAASRLKKQGRASSDPSPEHAEVEFWNYVLAGRDVELLFGRFPTVTDWLARHVV